MKPRKRHRNWMRLTTLLLVLCLLLAGVGASAEQEIDARELKQFNVMLVLDGSGSLVSGQTGTDRGGLRYDAIDLFLALLTNDGNNVGSIVFDDDPQNYLLNTGVNPVSGKTDKMNLSEKIRGAGTRNDTDIGSALLTAVETLKAEGSKNGMRSIIILFSDGRTDLGGDEEAYKASLEHKETAIVQAQEAAIPVYSICLDASAVADPAELQEISSRTSGDFVSVHQPEDLAGAFEAFYSLIFSTSGNEKVSSVFPENGTTSLDIKVPSHGAREVNIILNQQELESVLLSAPSRQMSPEEVKAATMSGGSYDVIKLVSPEVGTWKLTLSGTPKSSVTVNVIYNIDSSVRLTTADGGSNYSAGDTVSLQACLCRDGSPITDSAVTREYTAQLRLTNMADGTSRSLPMEVGDPGVFTYSLTEQDYNSYTAQALFSCDSIVLDSDELSINFGNQPPSIRDGKQHLVQKVIVTPITGHKRTLDLADYFSDAQDDLLHYSILSSQLVPDTVSLEEGLVTVNTGKSRSGDLVVRATDSQGAYSDMTIQFKVTNLTLAIFLVIIAAILVGLSILLLGAYRITHILFRGSISVSNCDADMGSSSRSHASFRGKLKLSYFAVGGCGLDISKCYFMAKPGGKLEFCSPKPFYVNGLPKTKVNIFAGNTTIHANVERTLGIRIRVDVKF